MLRAGPSMELPQSLRRSTPTVVSAQHEVLLPPQMRGGIDEGRRRRRRQVSRSTIGEVLSFAHAWMPGCRSRRRRRRPWSPPQHSSSARVLRGSSHQPPSRGCHLVSPSTSIQLAGPNQLIDHARRQAPVSLGLLSNGSPEIVQPSYLFLLIRIGQSHFCSKRLFPLHMCDFFFG